MDTEEHTLEEVGDAAPPPATLRSILADARVRHAMLGAFVAMLGAGMVTPILPLFARSFHVGYGAVALMISAYALSRLILDVVAGPMVQRMGERRSATTGVAVIGVAAALTAIAPAFGLAVAAWAVAGAGSALMFTAMYSYLLKIVPNDRMARTLSVFWGSISVSWIAGAPIGGALASLGLAVPLWVYAGMCLASAWVFHRWLSDPPAKPTAPKADGRPAGRPLRAMLRLRAFRAVIFVNLGLFWLFAGINTIGPLFAQRTLHLGTVGIGVAFTAFALTELLVLYPAGAASDRYGRKWLLVIGLLGLGVLTGALGLTTEPVAFAVLLGLAGVLSGVAGVSPPAMLADVTPADRSAVAVAAYRFSGDLGYVIGPLLAGATAQAMGFTAAFVVVAVPTLLSALFLLPIPETRRLRPEGAPEPAPADPASPATLP